MKSNWHLLVGILFFVGVSFVIQINFAFAETLLAEGETAVSTYSNTSIDSQVSTQNNIYLGISVLLLAIVLVLVYLFIKSRKRQPNLMKKNGVVKGIRKFKKKDGVK
jgi:hypothetical protein